MNVALDTNVVAYAEGINDNEKRDLAVQLVRNLVKDDVYIPVQVLGELYNVLVRKAGRSRTEARDVLIEWHDTFQTVGTTPDIMLAAADLATDHRLAIWDAVILSAASKVGCRLLLSEDLQDGFTWGGVTVVNPFSAPCHGLLATLLSGPASSPSV